MSDLTHTTNHHRFLSTKLELNSFPLSFPRKRQEQAETTLQIYTESEQLPQCRRLVVVLPDVEPDVFTLPKRIWNLAAADRREVLLISRPCRQENEFHSQVNLTTLAACIRDARVKVQTQQVLGMSLKQAVLKAVQPDDVIVCFEDHQVPGFLRKNRLADLLAQTTHLPVYTLKGPVVEMTDPISSHLLDFLLLFVCLVTLVAFFGLEVWIDQNTAGAIRSALEILAVFAEVWVIGACANKAFRI